MVWSALILYNKITQLVWYYMIWFGVVCEQSIFINVPMHNKTKCRWRTKAGMLPCPYEVCFTNKWIFLQRSRRRRFEKKLQMKCKNVTLSSKRMCQHQPKPMTSLTKHKTWDMVHMIGVMCLMQIQFYKLAHQQQMDKQPHKLAHHKQRNSHNML